MKEESNNGDNSNEKGNKTNRQDNKKKRSTFTVNFYLNRSKMKNNGLCPVVGRICIDGQMAQFSAKIDVDTKSKLWDVQLGRAIGKSKNSIQINRKIDSLKQEIESHYRELVDKQGYVTAELVKNILLGLGAKQKMFLALFNEHNEEFKLCVGINRVMGSYELFLDSYDRLGHFIKQHYGVDDIALTQINASFIDAFDFYLKTERRMGASTILRHTKVLKKIIKRAIHQGSIRKDPFSHYRAERPLPKYRYLTTENLQKLLVTPIESKAINFYRDMFIFACFSGISHADLYKLTHKELITEEDGSTWIHFDRQKTGCGCTIKLLSIPIELIEKYKAERKGNRIFNIYKRDATNVNLKKIASLCKIDQNLTFHMARHTYATQICLSGGVPIETLSKMMGHQTIQTTQIYAKITNQKINSDMKLLSHRIANKYTVFEDVKLSD